MSETRQIVVPGEHLGSTETMQPGQNTYVEGRDIFALRLGVKTVRGDRVNVISLSGRYEPFRGDMVIGTVAETGPSNWYISIGAANDVGMHVNDVPWRVEFGETSKYLAVGDTVLLKIVHVDEMKKAQVSMKDRQCRKLTGGLIFEVAPTKVPRIVGRQGSMITMLKDATNVRIFVGQNGKIWLDGEADDVKLALEGLQKIEAEAHTTGLTDRMKAWLEERRPSAQRTHKQSAEDEVEAEADQQITRERRGRGRPEESERAPPMERPPRQEARESPRRFEAERVESRAPRREERHEGHRHGRSESEKHRYQRAAEDDTADANLAERRGRDGRFHDGREREHAPRREAREERAPPREERPRRFEQPREERPRRTEEFPEERPRRFEQPREERPRRTEEFREEPRRRAPEREAEPAYERAPPRPRRFDDEAPRREERPAPRRFEEEAPRREERPMRRRMDEEVPPPRSRPSAFDAEREAPRRAPSRPSRFDDDVPETRPARRPSRFDDEEETPRAPPPRRMADADEDGEDERPVRREGGEGSADRRHRGNGRGRRGGRGRSGQGQE